jgi:ArsR family transcriptional regulator
MHMNPETLFAALANPTRLRCLLLLLAHKELCVCELTHVVGAAQPNMSRHLAQLREAQLVLDRREGHWIYYRLNPALPTWVSELLRAAAKGAIEFPPYAEDRATLARMPNRPGAPRCA